MLATDPKWTTKALVKIFNENQTQAEQAAEMVTEDNGIGFTGTDGQFLSSLAKQFIERNFLSTKQMSSLFRLMPKYHAQVIAFSDPSRLEKMVSEYNPSEQLSIPLHD